MTDSEQYNVGGLTLQASGKWLLERMHAMPEWQVFRQMHTSDSSLTVLHRERVHSVPSPVLADESFALENGVVCRIKADGQRISVHFSCGLLLAADITNQPGMATLDGSSDDGTLRYALWMAYALGALQKGAMQIHASAVLCNGQAVLCLGESGAGKSTHTRLWLEHIDGCQLLNDDCPVVRIEERGVEAYGSPWSGKTPCYRQEHAPVAAMVRIVKSPHNRITRLRGAEAFIELHRSCPPELQHTAATSEEATTFAVGVVNSVPVYRLECRPDQEAALLCHNTIFA